MNSCGGGIRSCCGLATLNTFHHDSITIRDVICLYNGPFAVVVVACLVPEGTIFSEYYGPVSYSLMVPCGIAWSTIEE